MIDKLKIYIYNHKRRVDTVRKKTESYSLYISEWQSEEMVDLALCSIIKCKENMYKYY